MLHGTGDAPAASAVPYFWSDQFDVKIHMVGWPLGADRIETVVEESRHLNRFFRDDRQVAAFSWNWPRQIALERRAIGHGGQLEAR